MFYSKYHLGLRHVTNSSLQWQKSITTQKVRFYDVKEAYDRIKSKIRKTPVFQFDDFNEKYQHRFYFKSENMQITGAFKIRGALNAVLKLKENETTVKGLGTVAVEFLDQVPDLEAILVQASGGGMAAGICIAAKHIKPDIKIIIVEPKGKNLERCLVAGERLWPDPPQWIDTVADSMRTQQLGFITWPIILKYAERRVVTVTDEEITEGMKCAFKNMKIVVEPSAAIAIAAAMSCNLERVLLDSKKVGVILSGGNVDVNNLPFDG